MLKLNKVHQGDCLEIMKKIDNNSIDIIVTDPPWGVNFKNSKFYEDSKDHVLDIQEIWLTEMYRVLKDGCHLYLFIPTLEIDSWVYNVKKIFNFKNIIANQVYVNNRHNKDNFGWDLQLILFASKDKAKRFNKVDWIPASDSWVKDKRNDKPKEFTYKYPSFISNKIIRSNYKNGSVRKRLHPNEKNHELIEKFILMSSNEGDIVLEPFAGSFSTCLAAQNTKRKWIGIELNKEYCEMGEIRLKSIFDPDIVEEDLKYIFQRDKWEKEVLEMELDNKLTESINKMNDRID